MCLILVAWRVHPGYPLVVAANRDEFHARNATRAGFWPDQPGILAGRDLEAGGTWMGFARGGKFAAVTNYRGGRDPGAVESRGALVARFLANGEAAADYVAGVAGRRDGYSGFNLLAADAEGLWWLSNRDGGSRQLAPGIYGLGNYLLDTPEVEAPKARFARVLESAAVIESLFGVLEPSRILAPEYGTRCSTVLLLSAEGIANYAERNFDPDGTAGETLRFDLSLRA